MLMRRFLNWWRGKSVKGTGKELQHHMKKKLLKIPIWYLHSMKVVQII